MNVPGPDSVLASQAGFTWLCGLALDHSGNILVADGNHWSRGFSDGGDNLVRVVATKSGTFYGQVMKAGHIYSIAGDSTEGYSGDNGPALLAELSGPAGIAVDPAGNVVFADTGNDRVRVIAATSGMFYGQPMTAGDIYTVAGDGTLGFSGDGALATAADPYAHVRLIAAKTGRFYGQKMTAAHIYAVAANGSLTNSGDGGPALSAGVLTESVAVDRAGNVLVQARRPARSPRRTPAARCTPADLPRTRNRTPGRRPGSPRRCPWPAALWSGAQGPAAGP